MIFRLAVLLVMLDAIGCGHRAALIPPLPRRPTTPTAVHLRQRGDRLEIQANYRLSLLSERPLVPPLSSVLLVIGVSSREAAAPLAGERGIRDFEAAAMTVPVAALPDGAPGKGVLRSDSVGIDQLGKAAAFVVAIALRDRRDSSLPTRRILFMPIVPPLPPPQAPTIVLREEGVQLSWSIPDDPRIKQLHVYRWKEGGREPATPWRSLDASAREWLDQETSFGDRLLYSVAAAADGGEVPVESAAVNTAVIEYKDLFAPLIPRDLDALPESRRIRVLWYPGGSADEAGIKIERQEEGQDSFALIGTAPAGEAMYVDGSVVPSNRYRYRLVAFDKAGNEAAPTTATEWVVPRNAP